MESESLGWREETSCARGCGGGGSADCSPRGAGPNQAVVVPVYDAGLAGQKTRRVVRGALEYRDRFTLPETDRAAPSHDRQEQRHAGERTCDGSLRIQLGTCRDVSSRSEEPHRPAPLELRAGAERGGLRLAQTGWGLHPGTISTRVFPRVKTCRPVYPAEPKTPSLVSTLALAASAWIPLQERRKLSGIGHSCLPRRHSCRRLFERARKGVETSLDAAGKSAQCHLVFIVVRK